jgi:hypothetical protein
VEVFKANLPIVALPYSKKGLDWANVATAAKAGVPADQLPHYAGSPVFDIDGEFDLSKPTPAVAVGTGVTPDGVGLAVNPEIIGSAMARSLAARDECGQTRSLMTITPDKFYKGRSQEKTHLQRLAFFLLRSPLDRARSVLTYRTRCSVAGQCDPVDWVFSTSGFHRLFATKPVSSETSKAERRSSWRP